MFDTENDSKHSNHCLLSFTLDEFTAIAIILYFRYFVFAVFRIYGISAFHVFQIISCSPYPNMIRSVLPTSTLTLTSTSTLTSTACHHNM